MKTHKRRGLLAKAGALLAVAALAFSASPAYAQTGMPQKSDVTITKLVQPGAPGENAPGTVQTITGGTAIEGVQFEAYEIPVTDGANALTKGTNAWQNKIATMTLADAQDYVSTASPEAVRTGETNTEGVITWTGEATATTGALPWGLYLIRETETPAGVVRAQDFLLAVPLSDPDPEGTGWLNHIYVYPKSSEVLGSMEVDNAEKFVVGDIATWTIMADIPVIRDNTNSANFLPTDFFGITQTFTAGELSQGTILVKLGEELLTAGTGNDYIVSPETAGDVTTVSIEFTKAGRAKLASALKNTATTQVTVLADTTVLKTGELSNQAFVYPSGSFTSNSKKSIGEGTLKYGNYNLTVTGTDNSTVKGAEFRVYLTEAAAKAKDDTPYHPFENPDGYLVPTGDAAGKFVTDADGKVSLGGLRDSFWADGKAVEKDATGYQKYWFAQISAPEGQQLLAEPVEFEINGENTALALTTPSTSNAFVLPLTGGTGTAMLTILGLGILAIVLFVARSRRNAEA